MIYSPKFHLSEYKTESAASKFLVTYSKIGLGKFFKKKKKKFHVAVLCLERVLGHLEHFSS